MKEKKKLLDEKGRLWGKVNLIDLVVILVILAVGAVVLLKLTGRGGSLPGAAQTSQIEYTVVVYRISPDVYASVEAEVAQGGEHAQLMASGAMLAGSQILSVTAVPHETTAPNAQGETVKSVEEPYVDAVFTIRATIQNPITQEVGTQEVRIGKSHIVKTKTFELVNGVVLSCRTVS